MVSKEELKKLMEEAGITPENAEKLAEELMKKYDTDRDGKITGQQFKDIVKAKAEDLAARIQDKLGSAPDAFKKWDTDGDGVLSEEEFVKGAKELGISEEAAREIFRKKAGPDGVMDLDEFTKAFGVGPDDVMERCFAKLGNPKNAFETADVDEDGVLSEEEWKDLAVKKLGFSEQQAERLFKEMDTNTGENTQGFVSMWEFYTYIDFEEPPSVTFGD